MAFCLEEELEVLHLELSESENETEPERFNPSSNLPDTINALVLSALKTLETLAAFNYE